MIRSRSAVAAAAISATLLLVCQGSASAAEGTFRYAYDHPHAIPHFAQLTDPETGTCLRLDLPQGGEAAYDVDNKTDTDAVVYLDTACRSSTHFPLRAGQKAPQRVLVRSVVFTG